MATSCGMAAISQVFLGLLKPGDHVVGHRSSYAGTHMLLDEDLSGRWSIDIERIDMRALAALRKTLKKQTRLVYFEPYANASMDFVDIKLVLSFCHSTHESHDERRCIAGLDHLEEGAGWVLLFHGHGHALAFGWHGMALSP